MQSVYFNYSPQCNIIRSRNISEQKGKIPARTKIAGILTNRLTGENTVKTVRSVTKNSKSIAKKKSLDMK